MDHRIVVNGPIGLSPSRMMVCKKRMTTQYVLGSPTRVQMQIQTVDRPLQMSSDCVVEHSGKHALQKYVQVLL